MRNRSFIGFGGTTLGLVLGLLALLPTAAFAHTGVGPTHGLLHGFTHPLFGWDHLLAMFAVGLWAAQRGDRSVWLLPAVFVGTMVVGGLLGVVGVPVPGVEAGILASVLVLGGLIALAARFPLALGVAAVALFALFHGHAHGTEMPAAVSGVAYGLGFAAATALLHATGILVVLAAQATIGERRHTWLRIAGASISAAGLALWLL